MADPYFSELKYLGGAAIDFIEVAVDEGYDVSGIQVIVYHPSGAVRTTNALTTVTDTVAGTDVYVLDTATSATFNGLHANGGAALVVDGVVTHFYSFNGPLTATGGPADGMTSTALGATGTGESWESTDGTNYTIQSTPTSGTVPCFVSGTLILTNRGEVPVEALEKGDLIETLDDGLQPLLWHGSFEISAKRAALLNAVPITIAKGALGQAQPARDLKVSPNHCMMMDEGICELLFAQREVLVTAKSLLGLAGVRKSALGGATCYHHLLFARHQIIFANGVATESLFPGRQAQLGMTQKNRSAIKAALATVKQKDDGLARMQIKGFEAKALIAGLVQRDDFAMAA